jgi:23S rRNA pseudouridine1911/1915/1917 synthase
MENSNEKYEHFCFIAEAGQTPLRIDVFLNNKIGNASRTKIQEAAKTGNILVNGKPVKSNYKVRPGDSIQITADYEPREIELLPENIPLNIVFEDETLIVLNKPSGMVVHPSYGHYSGTLVNALMFHLKDVPLFRSGEMRPGLVHRIDKNTSGLLVIAKTSEALTHLSKQFYDRTSDRRYHALIWGCPKQTEGTIDAYIGRNPKDRKLRYIFADPENGKRAVTHYKVLEDLGYVSLVECKLETGRTHQIRVHMQHAGHPLFNDLEYGGDKILKGTRFSKYKQFVQNCFAMHEGQALHAKTLAFDHPKTGERLFFDSEMPSDLDALIKKWRNYTADREIGEQEDSII